MAIHDRLQRQPAAPFRDRFSLDTRIKTHDGIESWAGTDLGTGKPVIVKVTPLRLLRNDQLRRIEREASVLKSLESGYSSRLIDYTVTEDAACLVLDRLPGLTLAEKLQGGRKLSPAEGISIGLQLLQALSELHDRGVLHRDIKPSNIVIDGEHAALIDFGLARSEMIDSFGPKLSVGTVLYMSPEQAGSLSTEIAPRSDLYSLGCVLYECLSGSPPFVGEDAGEVLRRHLNEMPAPLPTIHPDVPAALDRLIQKLLNKDPRRRFQSAASALVSLRRISEALARGEEAPSFWEAQPDDSHLFTALSDPGFVGRRRELQELRSTFDQARAGQGGIVLLEAESGGGKSRLLDEFAPESAWVLRGQALDRSAQRPFQILTGVTAGIIERARQEPAFRADLGARLEEQGQAICDALPEMDAIFGAQLPHLLGREELAEIRSIQALAALIEHLGSDEKPCLITLDDCQWADDLSLKLIAFLQRRPGSRPRRVLIVLAFRSEEVDSNHRLRQLTHVSRILLPPFGASDVTEMVRTMAGAIPSEIVETVSALSQGNPFMASAVLQGLLECGALLRSDDADRQSWTFDPVALREARASRKAGLFLARRLKDFPETTRSALMVGAVIGKEFDLGLAARLAKQTPLDAEEALAGAVSRKVIWAEPRAPGRYLFVHDKIRETLLDLLDSRQRQDLHLGAAEELEKTHPERIFDLAYHFHESGDDPRALPYAFGGALKARKQHALQISERYFRIACRGATEIGSSLRFRIHEGLGDVLMLQGRYNESHEEFGRARDLASDPFSAAQVDGRLGELAFKRGEVDTAAQAIETALRALDEKVPLTLVAVVAMLLFEAFVQALHTLLPGIFIGRKRRAPSEKELLRLRLYSRLAYINWFGKGKLPCGWAHLREMNLAERHAPTLELAQAYSEHAPVMTMVPWFSRGTRYVKESLKIREALDDVWGQGQSLHFFGIVLYASSRYEESIEKFQRATRLLERTGDRWEVNTSNWHIGYAYYRLGKLKDAYEQCRKTYEAGVAIGDHQAAGISLAGWAKATGGRVPAALIERERQRSCGDLHTRAEILQADALRLLHENDPEGAVACLTEARTMIRKAGLRQEYVAPVFPWRATALRMRFEAIPPLRHDQRERGLGELSASVKEALTIARAYRNNLPHALREAGYVEIYRGRPDRARLRLLESLRLARAQGARHEEALSLIALGEAGAARGWDDASSMLSQGRELQSRIESPLLQAMDLVMPSPSRIPVATISIADRFTSLQEVGRRIATALSHEAVFTSMREAGLVLLRGERCAILEPDSGDPTRYSVSPYGDPIAEDQISSLLVRQARETGVPALYNGIENVDVTDSIVLSEVSSVLCAPVRAHDRVAAWLYVTHSKVAGLFGEEEKRLAEFVATLAGAALENTQGFETAAAALRTRDDFFSIASHELKTPITSMLLQTQLIERLARKSGIESIPKEQLDRFIALNRKQLGHLTQLVNDLLDISRLETGKVQVKLAQESLDELAREMLDRFEKDLEAAGCSATLNTSEPVPIRADRTRVEQVIMNLLSNALKYARGTSIEVRVWRSRDRGLLSVTDQGPGIPPEHQARIFQKYERAISGTHISGLGLGLYICRELIEAQGGTIHLKSVPGKGSTFTVDLPAMD